MKQLLVAFTLLKILGRAAQWLVVFVEQSPKGLLVAVCGFHQLENGVLAKSKGHGTNVLHKVGVQGEKNVDIVLVRKELHVSTVSLELSVEICNLQR